MILNDIGVGLFTMVYVIVAPIEWVSGDELTLTPMTFTLGSKLVSNDVITFSKTLAISVVNVWNKRDPIGLAMSGRIGWSNILDKTIFCIDRLMAFTLVIFTISPLIGLAKNDKSRSENIIVCLAVAIVSNSLFTII